MKAYHTHLIKNHNNKNFSKIPIDTLVEKKTLDLNFFKDMILSQMHNIYFLITIFLYSVS